MSKLHIVFGSFALLLYLVLFTAGLSRDSAPYRERLLPQRPQASTVKTFSTMNDPSVVTAALASSTSHREQSQGPAAAPPFDLVAFLAVMCLFTPTNVAFLTLIAGFLGGCASNITFERTVQKDASNSTNLPPECIVFRTENPAASMFRSFLVYLGFMAGVYITTSSPFENSSPDQYVRFAATLSFFAFVVGYDPTKFRNWIDLLPKPPSKA